MRKSDLRKNAKHYPPGIGQIPAEVKTSKLGWNATRFRVGSPSGRVFLHLQFPVEGGGLAQVRIRARQSCEPRKLLAEVEDYLPVYPKRVGGSEAARIKFLREQLNHLSGPIPVLPDRKGFIRKGLFVGHGAMVRDGKILFDAPELLRFGPTDDLRGTALGAHTRILQLAEASDYLAFGIGIALAAPLQSYVRLYGSDLNSKQLLPEGAIFLFTGDSASGKSTLQRASLSLGGSPDRMIGFDFSRRGLAELAADNNDHMIAIDDTERIQDGPGDLVRALQTVIHSIPGGQSRRLSQRAQGSLPALRWNTLVMASSPYSIFDLAAQNRWTPTAGDRARIFEISVPGPERGGIANRIGKTAEQRAAVSPNVISELENGYTNNCGLIVPCFVHWLMKKNRTDRVLRLVNDFVEEVAGDSDGWEQRFARKFGVIYAALVLGRNAGLLQWPEELPLRAVRKCYRKAREAAMTDEEVAATGLTTLKAALARPGRLVECEDTAKPIEITDRTMAIQFRRHGEPKFGVLDEALTGILGGSRAKRRFTRYLQEKGYLGPGHGHAGTRQERLRIRRDGRETDRVRLWVIDARAFARP